jgi:multisubunit Na+/H+ antiporter MnhF subunit
LTTSINPAAPHALPSFITAPGETDTFLVVMAIFLVVAVLAVGLLFLRLHTLPERMAHGANKLQFEIVAVLGLLALFTHNHAFWVAGLFLALIDIPDFPGWLGRIARGVERIAGIKPEEIPAEVAAHGDHGGAAAKNATAIPDRTRGGSPKKEELIDA